MQTSFKESIVTTGLTGPQGLLSARRLNLSTQTNEFQGVNRQTFACVDISSHITGTGATPTPASFLQTGPWRFTAPGLAAVSIWQPQHSRCVLRRIKAPLH